MTKTNNNATPIIESIKKGAPQEEDRQTLSLYRRILDSIPDAIVVHKNGVIQFANHGAVELMALPKTINPLGKDIWSFFHPNTLESVKTAFDKLTSSGQIGDSIPASEHTIVRYDGSFFTGEIRSILIEDRDSPVIMSLTRDVSNEIELKKELKYNAYHDALTGLPNRRYFIENLDELLLDNQSSKDQQHAVLIIDMDRFKNINDSYGHDFGDDALNKMGLRLKSIIPENCFLSRIGGDEFAIICSNVAKLDDVLLFAEQFLALFTTPFIVRGSEFIMTPSIGVALYPQCGTNIDALVKHADLAMYSAKRKGGNKIEVYHPEESNAIEERLNIEHGIRFGLEKGEFELFYQPKVNLKSSELHSLEALIRWQPPNNEGIPPGKFIPIAEESGLIASLGEWVLREACYQNKQWQNQGFPPHVISVNVSPKQFQLVDMQKTIKTVLEETGLSSEWLEIEITEGLLIDNSTEIAKTLKGIREMGVKIAIDDFGTGYSSLNYLRLFKPNLLKIDQSFVSNMLTDHGHMSIVSAVIQLAHSLDMDVVAEGVETDQQSKRLQTEGCQIAQGFLFSHPLPADQFEQKWLAMQSITC